MHTYKTKLQRKTSLILQKKYLFLKGKLKSEIKLFFFILFYFILFYYLSGKISYSL